MRDRHWKKKRLKKELFVRPSQERTLIDVLVFFLGAQGRGRVLSRGSHGGEKWREGEGWRGFFFFSSSLFFAFRRPMLLSSTRVEENGKRRKTKTVPLTHSLTHSLPLNFLLKFEGADKRRRALSPCPLPHNSKSPAREENIVASSRWRTQCGECDSSSAEALASADGDVDVDDDDDNDDDDGDGCMRFRSRPASVSPQRSFRSSSCQRNLLDMLYAFMKKNGP